MRYAYDFSLKYFSFRTFHKYALGGIMSRDGFRKLDSLQPYNGLASRRVELLGPLSYWRRLHANLIAKTLAISLALTGDDLSRLNGSSANR